MGTYCYECGQKMIGGIIPTTCKCYTLYCESCWSNLFKNIFKQSDQTYYTKSNDQWVEVTTPLFIAGNSRPKCPECLEYYNFIEFDYY